LPAGPVVTFADFTVRSQAVHLEGSSPDLWQDLGRLAFASLLGGLLGLERRIQAQPAGVRTQMVIAAACCLAVELSRHLPWMEHGGDPGRIAQSVLQGIGFVGAGAILKSGLSVHGLTTAATIWASATIGMASGAGLLVQASLLAAIVGVGLIVLEPVELALTRRRELRRIVVDAGEIPNLLDRLEEVFRKHQIRLDEVGMSHKLDQKRVTFSLVAACPERMRYPDLVRELGGIAGVTEVRIE
jgi:putative Mg2+ transporter-C (MgtC) family protein